MYERFKRKEGRKAKIATLCEYVVSPLYDGSKKVKWLWVVECGCVKGKMQLGVDGVFVGSGIFKSGDPAKRADAIVKAVTHYQDPKMLAEISRNLGEPMVGRQIGNIPEQELIAGRGW